MTFWKRLSFRGGIQPEDSVVSAAVRVTFKKFMCITKKIYGVDKFIMLRDII